MKEELLFSLSQKIRTRQSKLKKKPNCSLMKGTTQKQTSRRTASKHDLEDLKGIALCINYRNVPL